MYITFVQVLDRTFLCQIFLSQICNLSKVGLLQRLAVSNTADEQKKIKKRDCDRQLFVCSQFHAELHKPCMRNMYRTFSKENNCWRWFVDESWLSNFDSHSNPEVQECEAWRSREYWEQRILISSDVGVSLRGRSGSYLLGRPRVTSCCYKIKHTVSN